LATPRYCSSRPAEEMGLASRESGGPAPELWQAYVLPDKVDVGNFVCSNEVSPQSLNAGTPQGNVLAQSFTQALSDSGVSRLCAPSCWKSRAYVLCCCCCGLCASSRLMPLGCGQFRMIRRSVKIGKFMANIHEMAQS